ncbi:symmetrical bis(5'-nucleosyl)-tetraphosphatase [Buchnera aphidicola (Muscaphis stroyani)]|uniref:Bis(5'-nucleosyl)-tetraphosphatase, symmetrical n=1 Tax=Buchnera aphidicola (Muscaphis stroyani) TaxID=1241869 RepID=A0A4D6YCK9_9GAMM|nr:symmetrical bis(5'-nucleosyl)-tetraphosphatase [Buchnera aphidicola]QCI24241.1 symmetrical bis(5'-nucleosyl)-tetraphosphatase [Buchnera aphidicola (Muscaphis stroyani)]
MSIYLVGDIHGCYEEFQLLLKKSSFNIEKDFLWVSGDLVSRGPDSIKVIKYLFSVRKRVKIVLGNHDLNLILIHSGIKKNKKENFFDEFLTSKDNLKLIYWLRSQPFVQIDHKNKIIMSHAGISPQWDICTAEKYSKKISEFLLSDNYALFLESMFDNNINYWSSNLNRLDRLRYSINVFTRMRYCYFDGRLNLSNKLSPLYVKHPLKPWFMFKTKIPSDYSIFFGHWSNLKGFDVPLPFFSLDTGCCWGGSLSMIRLEDKKWFSQSFIKKSVLK